ncbi:unnamed protein product [Staurois parvus]|uniref:Uncharacterized protein n=1 Tax=Staurois parvus TaxID=386267 RepID=A0ABN9BTY0_9NEOB|nr:unnamed protein product [Staurois parvus]
MLCAPTTHVLNCTAVCTDHPCSELSPLCAPTTHVLSWRCCAHRLPVS